MRWCFWCGESLHFVIGGGWLHPDDGMRRIARKETHPNEWGQTRRHREICGDHTPVPIASRDIALKMHAARLGNWWRKQG